MKIKTNKKDKIKHRIEKTYEKGEADFIQQLME